MEADQVNPARDTAEQAYKGVGVAFVVVEAGEHGVLEAHAPLSGEVVLAQQFQDFCQREGFLDGHHGLPFVREGVMEADGQVALAAVQKLFQPWQYADTGQGYAFRAPCKAPVGRQDLYRGHDGVEVVQGLSHAHENSVCEGVGLIDCYKLRQDVGYGKVAVEALTASHAEVAAHLATGL